METITIPVIDVVQTKDEITQFAKYIEEYVKKYIKLRMGKPK